MNMIFALILIFVGGLCLSICVIVNTLLPYNIRLVGQRVVGILLIPGSLLAIAGVIILFQVIQSYFLNTS